MKQGARTVAKFALRVFVAVGIFCVALEILAFGILFCLLGFFSEIARPVALLSAFIFILSALVMMIASVWIAVAPSALENARENPKSPSRVEKIISGFIGSFGGCVVGLLSFLFIWASYGRLDLAFFAFHSVLLAFTFLAYAYPTIVPEISLSVIDAASQFLASLFG